MAETVLFTTEELETLNELVKAEKSDLKKLADEYDARADYLVGCSNPIATREREDVIANSKVCKDFITHYDVLQKKIAKEIKTRRKSK